LKGKEDAHRSGIAARQADTMTKKKKITLLLAAAVVALALAVLAGLGLLVALIALVSRRQAFAGTMARAK